VVKALVAACDAKQVALHEPLLAMLFDATAQPQASAALQPEGGALGDSVGYRTYTFGSAASTAVGGTVVALRCVACAKALRR
jgi:hypothetical protein